MVLAFSPLMLPGSQRAHHRHKRLSRMVGPGNVLCPVTNIRNIQDPGKIGFRREPDYPAALFCQFKQVAKDSDSGSMFPRGLLVLHGIRALKTASRLP